MHLKMWPLKWITHTDILLILFLREPFWLVQTVAACKEKNLFDFQWKHEKIVESWQFNLLILTMSMFTVLDYEYGQLNMCSLGSIINFPKSLCTIRYFLFQFLCIKNDTVGHIVFNNLLFSMDFVLVIRHLQMNWNEHLWKGGYCWTAYFIWCNGYIWNFPLVHHIFNLSTPVIPCASIIR